MRVDKLIFTASLFFPIVCPRANYPVCYAGLEAFIEAFHSKKKNKVGELKLACANMTLTVGKNVGNNYNKFQIILANVFVLAISYLTNQNPQTHINI